MLTQPRHLIYRAHGSIMRQYCVTLPVSGWLVNDDGLGVAEGANPHLLPLRHPQSLRRLHMRIINTGASLPLPNPFPPKTLPIFLPQFAIIQIKSQLLLSEYGLFVPGLAPRNNVPRLLWHIIFNLLNNSADRGV